MGQKGEILSFEEEEIAFAFRVILGVVGVSVGVNPVVVGADRKDIQ